MSNKIIIEDWTGKVLFTGSCKSKKVDLVLAANRCETCDHDNINESCSECNGTGYWGDFEVRWDDDSRDDNVYEFINY